MGTEPLLKGDLKALKPGQQARRSPDEINAATHMPSRATSRPMTGAKIGPPQARKLRQAVEGVHSTIEIATEQSRPVTALPQPPKEARQQGPRSLLSTPPAHMSIKLAHPDGREPRKGPQASTDTFTHNFTREPQAPASEGPTYKGTTPMGLQPHPQARGRKHPHVAPDLLHGYEVSLELAHKSKSPPQASDINAAKGGPRILGLPNAGA